MNDTREFDRAVARWLDDGSDVTAPEVIDSVLLAVRTTPQEKDLRILRTTSPLATYLGLAAVLAIVVVAGVSALYALGLGPNVGFIPSGDPPSPTTDNGQAVPVPYSALDGEVTFDAAPPWRLTDRDRTSTTLGGVGRGSASQFTMFTVVTDPLTGVGCEAGPAPADAEALVRSIRSNPDLEATDPVAVSVGGIDALLMDVVAPGRGQLEVGDCMPRVLEQLWLWQDGRMRLYLLDLPDGMSARILAIAIIALDSEFEHVVEAAGPIVDSFEFHAE